MMRSRRPARGMEGQGEGVGIPTPIPAVYWQSLVGRLVERLAHEIRNPLNGAMVNLQVVSSRAARPGQDAGELAPFAAAAAAELERTAALVESLLTVLRPARIGDDVTALLRALGELYTAVLRRSGGSLAILTDETDDTRSSLPPERIRLALAAALDAVVSGGGGATVRVQRTPRIVSVELRHEGGMPDALAALAPLLAQLEVEGALESDRYILHFPAVAAEDS